MFSLLSPLPRLPVRVSVALFMSCRRRRFGSSVYGPLDVGSGVGILGSFNNEIPGIL